jgi:predicted transcriptional regulator
MSTETATASTLTTKEVADKLGTTPRRLRRFLRAERHGVGTGKRYEFTAPAIATLKKAFSAWDKANAPTKSEGSPIPEPATPASEVAEANSEVSCAECDKKFKTEGALRSHTRIHLAK